MTPDGWAMAPVLLGAVLFVSGFVPLVFGGYVDEDRASWCCRVAPAVGVMLLGAAVAFA